MAVDPWCCAAEKMRAGLDGFDHGALVAWRSAWHLVKRLDQDQCLELIREQIETLEAARPPAPGG